jgi:sensor domain CHASE-containing protein
VAQEQEKAMAQEQEQAVERELDWEQLAFEHSQWKQRVQQGEQPPHQQQP